MFKGKGRDPLNPNNYRGITLTSVISKCLEIALLNRLESDKGFPHYGQTAYQKGISCADAIFSTQEAILQHMRDGDPTLCCFDPVLLEHLFKLGINGKCFITGILTPEMSLGLTVIYHKVSLCVVE